MKKETKDAIGFFLVLFIVVLLWIYSDLYLPFKEKQVIEKKPQVTKALITKYNDLRFRAAKETISYEFYDKNNIKCFGSRSESSFNFSHKSVNKYAYVVYNGDDPKYSFLLLYKDDFEAFKLPQPDSIFMRQK